MPSVSRRRIAACIRSARAVVLEGPAPDPRWKSRAVRHARRTHPRHPRASAPRPMDRSAEPGPPTRQLDARSRPAGYGWQPACRGGRGVGRFMLKPLLIALQFLTRLPVKAGDWSDRDVGRSMLFYPLVGVLLGLALAGVAAALHGAASGVVAAVL